MTGQDRKDEVGDITRSVQVFKQNAIDKTRMEAETAEAARAGDAIQNVSATIGRIDEISAAIASVVEEQSAATQEIARNVEEAARGTQEASSNISGVTSAAGEAGEAAASVLTSARRLSTESGTLRSSVSDFVAKVRNG